MLFSKLRWYHVISNLFHLGALSPSFRCVSIFQKFLGWFPKYDRKSGSSPWTANFTNDSLPRNVVTVAPLAIEVLTQSGLTGQKKMLNVPNTHIYIYTLYIHIHISNNTYHIVRLKIAALCSETVFPWLPALCDYNCTINLAMSVKWLLYNPFLVNLGMVY